MKLIVVLVAFLLEAPYCQQQRFFSRIPAGSRIVSDTRSRSVAQDSLSQESPGAVVSFPDFPQVKVDDTRGSDGRNLHPVTAKSIALTQGVTHARCNPSSNDCEDYEDAPSVDEVFSGLSSRHFPNIRQRFLGEAKPRPTASNGLPQSFLSKKLPVSVDFNQLSTEAEDLESSTADKFAPECPDADHNYLFRHPEQCDAFYLCDGGFVQLRLCPDGLVFIEKENKCLSPSLNSCDGRPKLQPPRGTGMCIRQNGKFHSSSSCSKFFYCENNKPTMGTCAGGLVFDPKTRICNWADRVLRPGCFPSDLLGVRCPNPILTEEEASQAAGLVLPFGDHSRHEDPSDCRFYFICLKTGHPRRAGCGDGEVFDRRTGICTHYKEVPGCENYYS
jgi:hypothetical protein